MWKRGGVSGSKSLGSEHTEKGIHEFIIAFIWINVYNLSCVKWILLATLSKWRFAPLIFDWKSPPKCGKAGGIFHSLHWTKLVELFDQTSSETFYTS